MSANKLPSETAVQAEPSGQVTVPDPPKAPAETVRPPTVSPATVEGRFVTLITLRYIMLPNYNYLT